MAMESKRQPLGFANRLRRWATMVLMAVMIGFSNSILEEDRSVNNTRLQIEQQDVAFDDET